MGQARRFFVSIEIPDRRAANRALEHGFDFFEEGLEVRTAEAKAEAVPRLGGLLTLEQVEQLVRAGIPVLVREDATPQLEQPVPSAEFDEWFEDFQRTFPAPNDARPLVMTAKPARSHGRKKT